MSQRTDLRPDHPPAVEDKDVTASESPKPWWKGARGEWYLAVQAALFLLLVFGPRTFGGASSWGYHSTRLCSLGGVILMLGGALLAAAGTISLGRNLTPLPEPKEKVEWQ